MTKPTKQTVTAVVVFAVVFTGALLFGPALAAAAPLVRQAGSETLQLVDAAGQPQTTWTVEGAIQDVLQSDTTLYVACGPRGVLIFDLAAPEKPALIGRIAEGRNVVKLAQNGKSLLVVVADFSALTFSLADPQKPQPAVLNPPAGGSAGPPVVAAAPAAPAPAADSDAAAPTAPPRTPRARWAQVNTVRRGWVAVTTSAPVQLGDRFIVHSQRRVRVSDPTLAQPLYAPSDEATGMFVVSRVSGHIASGPLPRGTIAEPGDLAEPTPAPLYAAKVAPRLWYGMGRFYGTLRPVLGVSSSSYRNQAPFAMLNDLTLEYYFRVPLKLGVQLQPLGLVLGKYPGVNTQIRALISFASSYFELGLESGAALHVYQQADFVVGYMLRLGSLDGLNLILHNSYILGVRSGSTSAVAFDSLSGEINIPLASRFNLHLSGGGGQQWAYGTAGLKYYARGGGGPGTLIVTSGVGGAWVSDHCEYRPNSTNAALCQTNSTEAVGPMLALGLDARF